MCLCEGAGGRHLRIVRGQRGSGVGCRGGYDGSQTGSGIDPGRGRGAESDCPTASTSRRGSGRILGWRVRSLSWGCCAGQQPTRRGDGARCGPVRGVAGRGGQVVVRKERRGCCARVAREGVRPVCAGRSLVRSGLVCSPCLSCQGRERVSENWRIGLVSGLMWVCSCPCKQKKNTHTQHKAAAPVAPYLERAREWQWTSVICASSFVLPLSSQGPGGRSIVGSGEIRGGLPWSVGRLWPWKVALVALPALDQVEMGLVGSRKRKRSHYRRSNLGQSGD